MMNVVRLVLLDITLNLHSKRHRCSIRLNIDMTESRPESWKETDSNVHIPAEDHDQ